MTKPINRIKFTRESFANDVGNVTNRYFIVDPNKALDKVTPQQVTAPALIEKLMFTFKMSYNDARALMEATPANTWLEIRS